MTHHFEGHTFDCLETVTDGRYLVTLQLTVRYTVTEPSAALTGYITLTIFGTDLVSIVAKTSFNIPGPEKRKASTVKQPVAMVRSVSMHTGDKLCVTVSNPELIYVSNIDNFLTFVYL